MKTIFYLLAFYFCIQNNAKAQSNSFELDETEQQQIVKKNDCDGLKPVFYNFSRRRLYTSNKMPLNPRHFLELCRGINDPGIREQIRRYDQLTRNKRKLIGAMIFMGVAGYITFMGSVIASSMSSGDGAYIGMSIGAASMLIVAPALAISTAAPHQKRKTILFHDLPEAYNFYVTSHPNQ